MGSCIGKNFKEKSNKHSDKSEKRKLANEYEMNNRINSLREVEEMAESKSLVKSKYPKYCNYERDSFDRFGDDFCELILSYLEIDEKIRLQYVNRQWKRCIFNKVDEIDYPLNLNNENMKIKISTEVLKKCKYVKKLKISINCDEKLLKLVSDNFKYLQEVEVKFNKLIKFDDKILTNFLQNCRKNLKNSRKVPGLAVIINYGKCFINLHEMYLKTNSFRILMRSSRGLLSNSLQLKPRRKIIRKRKTKFSSIESLRFIPKLKKLQILFRPSNEDSLKKINLDLPKLELIEFVTFEPITDKISCSLAKNDNLETMQISRVAGCQFNAVDCIENETLEYCKIIRININSENLNLMVKKFSDIELKFKFSWKYQRFGFCRTGDSSDEMLELKQEFYLEPKRGFTMSAIMQEIEEDQEYYFDYTSSNNSSISIAP